MESISCVPEISKKTAVGKYALDFTQNDTLGKPVSLSSFKGKYVLVDFWASWCGPCRQENPNVVKAFNKYRDKNFTILGVSLDRPNAKDRWLKAIHDDGLAWNHVSDLKYWDNEVAKVTRKHNDCNIICIPARFVALPYAEQMIETFISTEFEGGRHANRTAKIAC